MNEKSKVMYARFRGMDRRSRINVDRSFMYDLLNMHAETDGSLRKIDGTKRVSWRHGTENKVRFDTGASDYISEFGSLFKHEGKSDNLIAFARTSGEFFPFIYEYNREGLTPVHGPPAVPVVANPDRIDWTKYSLPTTFPLQSNGGLTVVPDAWLTYRQAANFVVGNYLGYYDVDSDSFVDVEQVAEINKDFYDGNNSLGAVGDPSIYVPPRGVYIEEHLSRLWMPGIDNYSNCLLHTQPFSHNFYRLLAGVPTLLYVEVGSDGTSAGNISDRIVACKELHETLYIFKTKSIHRLLGTSVGTFDTAVVNKEIGTEHPRSLVSSEYGLTWLHRPDKGIYHMSGQGPIQRISDPIQPILDLVPVNADFSASLIAGRFYALSWGSEGLWFDLKTQSWFRTDFVAVSGTDERFSKFCSGEDILQYGACSAWKLDPDGTVGEDLDIIFETMDDSCREEHSSEKDFYAYNMFYRCPDVSISMDISIDGRRTAVRPSNIHPYPRSNYVFDGFKMEDLPTTNAVFYCPMLMGYTSRAKVTHASKHAFRLERMILFYTPSHYPESIGVQT